MRLSTAPTGDEDEVLALDAGHWARQGRVAFDLQLDGRTIIAADLVAGFMHRGAEKLFEVRDYRQGLALANRHDWLAPVGGEILLARAAEDLLGMGVPERGRAIRLLLLETTRVAASLAFLGPAAAPAHLPDASTVARSCLAAREEVLTLLEQASGARMHLTYVVVGGVREPLPRGWCAQLRACCDRVTAEVLPALERGVGAASFTDRCAGLGVVEPDRARAHGASGVVGRASGLALDLRATEPDYDGHRHLLPAPASAPPGDTAERLRLQVAELRSALALAAALADPGLEGEGDPVGVPLPKVLRVPVGSSAQWLETPLGAAGGLLESRGDRAPHRYALRTPSSAHAPLLAAALVGHTVDDVAAIVSSFPIVVGDLDK